MKEIEEVVKQFSEAQEFNSELSKYLDANFKFSGKSAKEWKKHFLVKIPEEITLATIVSISSELFTKYQLAAALRDKETMQLTIMEQSRIDKYNSAYQIARNDHEKKFNKGLAAKSCEIEATIAVKDLEDALSNQRLAKDFWKATCDSLTELRKLLEIMSYALSNDVKLNRDINIMAKQ
jgi:hypothetical protein